MEKEQRVFLAYRAVFEGNNALVRQPKAIQKVVSKHRKSANTLLKSLGEKQVIDTLKTLLERKVFQSELEAKLTFPKLFTISSAQNVQHITSEADTARSEAEALDDVASLGGDEDDAQDEFIDEAPSLLMTAGTQTQTTSNVVHIPSLYPIYIPFKTQHLVLSRAQTLLEECCYDFTAQWLPEMLEQRRWDCPEAVELNKWSHIMVKRSGKLPSQAFAKDSTLSLAGTLTSINKLRHSAVHRLPTTAKGISEMIRSATRFASSLRDSAREQQLEELDHELEGKIRALELNKNYLETKLERELQDIARQRRELDEKEKETIVTMLKEDKDHGSLIGGLLSKSVKLILGKSENTEPEVTEAERSSDLETELEEEQKHAGMYVQGHREEVDPSVTRQFVFDCNTESQKREPRPDHEPLSKGEGRTQSAACLSTGSKVHQSVDHAPNVLCDLRSETVQPSTSDPQQISIPESELARHSSSRNVESAGSEVNEIGWESKLQDDGDYSAPQEVENRLSRILSQDLYIACTKAVDDIIDTGKIKKLSDKRLRKIHRYVKEQTRLDTALHQNELDNLIRLRFATFKSEKRQPTNSTSKKKKKSTQSIAHADVTFSKSWEPDTIDSPLERQPIPLQGPTMDFQPLPQELSSPSPPPLPDIPLPELSLPPSGSPSPSCPSAESHDASKPKTYQLTAVGDSISPGRLGLLWIDENGRVEGKMVVDNYAISLV